MGRSRARLIRGVLVAAWLVLGGLALLATGQLLWLGLGLARGGASPLLAAAGMAAAAGTTVLLMDRLAASRASTAALVLVGLAVVVIPRVAVSVAFDAPATADALAHHHLALGVLADDCCFGPRPMGYPMLLAGAYRAFGSGPPAVELLNIALATVSGALLFDAARRTWGRRAATLAVSSFAVLPSQVLMVLPPLAEPLYATVLLAACWLLTRSRTLDGMMSAVAGASLGAAQYVRPTAAPLIVALGIAVAVRRDGRRLAASLTLAALGLVVVLLPVLAFNLEAHGELSVSTSAYGGWTLYVGANQASDGRWNRADADRLAQLPGASTWDRSAAAGREAIDRIASDPLGYAGLMVRKVGVVWADESFAPFYALPATLDDPMRAAVTVGAQVPYVALLAAAAWSVRRRRRPRAVVVFVVGVLLIVVAIQLFVEAHSRYHAYLDPLLALVAAGAAGRRRVSGR